MGHKELIKTEKEQLLQFLIVNSHNGKLLHGKINEAATRFDCHRGQFQGCGPLAAFSVANLAAFSIMPAIKRVWPSSLSKVIFIQQDNAKPHIQDSDCDFRNAASSDGFEITLVQQPPNSPDTNVNDLGFFRAIQSIQQKHVCKNAPQLVDAVVSSFNQLEATTLNKVFLTLQSCMIEILKAKGHNNFKVPHMKKDALIRQHALPINLEVPEELVRQNINHLIEAGSAGGIAGLMTDLNMDGSAGGIARLMTDLNMDGSAGGIAGLMTDLNIDGV